MQNFGDSSLSPHETGVRTCKPNSVSQPTCHCRVTCPLIIALSLAYTPLPQTPTSTPVTYPHIQRSWYVRRNRVSSRISRVLSRSTPPGCGSHGTTHWIKCSPSSGNSSLHQRVTGSGFRPRPALAMALALPLPVRILRNFS